MAPIAFDDICHDHKMVSALDKTLGEERILGGQDIFLRLGYESHLLRLDTVEKGETMADPIVWAEGEDGGMEGAEMGDKQGHVPAEGEDYNLGLGESVGQADRGGHRLFPWSFGERFISKPSSTAALDPASNPVKDFHAFYRVLSHTRLSAQHDGVGLLKDGIGHIGDLSSGGKRIGDHGLEHVGGDDHWSADPDAVFDNPALDDGQLFHGALHPKITASDHDNIGCGNDVFDELDRVLVLDFGDDVGVASQALELGPHCIHVGLLPAEAESEVVDLKLDADRDVFQVFFGHGWQVDFDPGQVDVPAGPEDSAGEYLTAHLVVFLSQYLHVEIAIVDHHHIFHRDVVDQSIVVDVDGVFFLALSPAYGEFDDVPGMEVEISSHVSRPDRRTLGIHHDGNVGRGSLGYLADAWNNLAHPVVGGVAHVEAKNVGSSDDQSVQHLGGLCGRAKGADNFCFAHREENRLWSLDSKRNLAISQEIELAHSAVGRFLPLSYERSFWRITEVLSVPRA